VEFDDDTYAIERNISLEATTSEYIAAYRALTPKFNPIDLSEFNTFKLEAKGTGTLIVRLVKASISNWELQYKTSIALTDDLTVYTLPFSEFKSSNGMPLKVNDITSMVFTMLAENGTEVTKSMTLEQLRFSKIKTLSMANLTKTNALKTVAIPNPMVTQTTIHFTAKKSETVQLLVYNQVGRLVKQMEVNAISGNNEILLERENLSSGIYFCNIKSNQSLYKTIKLLMN